MNQAVSSTYGPKFFAVIALITALWGLLVYQPLYNAIAIWIGNDIYNHCLLVLPASIYLIWERRNVFCQYTIKSSWLAIVPTVLSLILYTLGTAADIQLFQHAGLFALLPSLFWLVVGDKIAWKLKFPLFFILFAIPVGEELIPYLQEITADMSVVMLQWTGVPLFRSGLFIEIPGGKFLVAEACSGVSFLIASIVLGNLYAYMNLKTMKYRIGFVVLSAIFPIIANAIRVYGIILIAHLTDMEHAVGADHLIYGWFFFAFVLICLFLIGEVVRKFEKKKLRHDADNSTDFSKLDSNKKELNVDVTKALVIGIVLLIGALIQDYRMQSASEQAAPTVDITLPFERLQSSPSQIQWLPTFTKAASTEKLNFRDDDVEFELFYALYDSDKGEVVSSLNRVYQQERWTLASRNIMQAGRFSINEHRVASSFGTQRVIYFWYVMNGEVMASKTAIKLAEALNKLKGTRAPSGFFAVSLEAENNTSLNAKEQSFEVHIESIIQRSLDEFSKSSAVE